MVVGKSLGIKFDNVFDQSISQNLIGFLNHRKGKKVTLASEISSIVIG